MKTLFHSFILGGGILIFLSSCATVPTEPPAPGEVRLLKVRFTEIGAIKMNLQYEVHLNFESAGEIEVKRACFFWSGNGPHCFPIKDIWYGIPGTIVTIVTTPEKGLHSCETYVLYVRDGRTLRSNMISTPVEITK